MRIFIISLIMVITTSMISIVVTAGGRCKIIEEKSNPMEAFCLELPDEVQKIINDKGLVATVGFYSENASDPTIRVVIVLFHFTNCKCDSDDMSDAVAFFNRHDDKKPNNDVRFFEYKNGDKWIQWRKRQP